MAVSQRMRSYVAHAQSVAQAKQQMLLLQRVVCCTHLNPCLKVCVFVYVFACVHVCVACVCVRVHCVCIYMCISYIFLWHWERSDTLHTHKHTYILQLYFITPSQARHWTESQRRWLLLRQLWEGAQVCDVCMSCVI